MSTSTYAKGTDVPVVRSKAELEGMLRAAGANGFALGWEEGADTTVMFRMANRMLRMRVAEPDPVKLGYTRTGKSRTDAAFERAMDAERRRMWRALVLLVKARLVAVTEGIETVETAFLPWVVIPGTDGQTVGEWFVPQLAQAYQTNGGSVPSMIPGGPVPKAERKALASG